MVEPRRTGRNTAVSILFSLVAVAVAASSALGMGAGSVTKERSEVKAYDVPAPLFWGGVIIGGHLCGDLQMGSTQEGHGCFVFQASEKDRFISIHATDASGLPAPGFVDQMAGPIRSQGGVYFCGDLPKTKVWPGPIQVVIHQPRAVPMCQGAATTGTVEVTYYSSRGR